MSENKTNWVAIVSVVVVVAVLASFLTVSLTGNVIKLNADARGKNLVYTQAEVDAKFNAINAMITNVSMLRYSGCTSIGMDSGTGDSACAIENKTCKFGLKVWSRHNESDFGTEGPITDVIPVVSDCSTNWGTSEGQDQVINYLCC